MDKTLILQQFAFQRWYLSLLVDDIPAEQMTIQPPGVVNHPAWHLGHLAFVSDRFASALGEKPTLDSWKDRYGPWSIPTADTAAYFPKPDLVAALDDRRAALARAFEQATPEQLAAPNPNAMLLEFVPTLGNLILNGMLTHESTHLGQLAVWRKAMGMPAALMKLRK